MKQMILDFIRGIVTGLIYMGCFCAIGAGVYLICELRTTTPWVAIVAFLLASFLIVGAVTLLTALGRSDREMEDRILESEDTE